MSENGKLDQAKSLHIFMFPFIWQEGNNKKITNALQHWKEEKENHSDDPWEWDYNQTAYFYTNANQAINDSGICIVSNWKYDLPYGSNIYLIKIKAEDSPYRLSIDRIRLKLHNTGIGILSFHLINYEYVTEEDILRINDYGRRIFPPYLPLDQSQNTILPEFITLLIGQDVFSENFGSDEDYMDCSHRISKTIMSLFGDQFSYSSKSNDKIVIKPVIDDRMFVVCWWCNDERSDSLKYSKEIMKNGDFWHKFFFIDHGESSCQNNAMLRNLLQKHAYDRWLNKGTLYGITRYSLMLLTSINAPFYLRVHMWTIYYQMACLALAQRASILKFSQDISEIVGNENNIDSQQVQALHYEYLKFINQLYFREVTAQEQGIEMYDMLTSSMAIERDVKRLDEEIAELYQHIRLKEDKKTNENLYLLTVLGALFIFPNLLTSFFGMNVLSESLLKSLTGIDTLFLLMLFIVPISLALFFLWNKTKSKKNVSIYLVLKIILIGYLIAGIWCFMYGKEWLCG